MRTDVITITEKAQVEEAARLMLDNQVTHLPVVTDDKKLIGIVTSWDLSKSIATDSKDLMDIMTKTVKFCKAEDTIEEISHKMKKFDISCLPVVDDDLILQGIITTDQISHLISYI